MATTASQVQEWVKSSRRCFGDWRLDPTHSGCDDYIAFKGGDSAGCYVSIQRLATGNYGLTIGTYGYVQRRVKLTALGRKLCASPADCLAHLASGGVILPEPVLSKF